MPPLLQLELGHFQDRLSEVAKDQRASEIFSGFRDSLRKGDLPISMPLADEDALLRVREIARRLREEYEQFVLIGIGGSTLGFRACLQAAKGPFHNLFPGADARIFVVDNVDPTIAAQLLGELDFRRTMLVYISKSGSTPEPAANFLVFLERLKAVGGDARDLVIVCDQADNGINQIAQREGCHLLHIPAPLPGRYSVLSSVGTLPCELSGIDAGELLRGARAVHDRALASPPEANPCFLLGALLHRKLRADRRIHFLFSYSDRLSELNLWFTQLWSESLGKRYNRKGEEVRAGSTPVTGVGATDQHSILQLLKEGPLDKVVGFLKVASYPDEVKVPSLFQDLVEYEYFGGHTLAEQLGIEELSTEISLHREGVPCYSMTLSDLGPAALGAFFYLWQLTVVFVAQLEGINPFDQPGVEEGKRMTYSLMGREDHREHREQHAASAKKYAEANRVLAVDG